MNRYTKRGLLVLEAQPNPKQRDIDLILDRRHVPKSMQDRDLKLWPGDKDASAAALDDR